MVFDKRGVGLSDRFDEAPTADQRIGDIISVLDAVGWEKAQIHGMSEGGLMAQHFVAEHPQRALSLGLLNSSISPRYARHDARRVRGVHRPGSARAQGIDGSWRL